MPTRRRENLIRHADLLCRRRGRLHGDNNLRLGNVMYSGEVRTERAGKFCRALCGEGGHTGSREHQLRAHDDSWRGGRRGRRQCRRRRGTCGGRTSRRRGKRGGGGARGRRARKRGSPRRGCAGSSGGRAGGGASSGAAGCDARRRGLCKGTRWSLCRRRRASGCPCSRRVGTRRGGGLRSSFGRSCSRSWRSGGSVGGRSSCRRRICWRPGGGWRHSRGRCGTVGRRARRGR